ncbi:MAG: hypothetical protein EHM93_16520 [Bacteroidales bacterium]|nr:MAG: hypothetical protein EHM93_16520 [Bacteroidales bacterium]
MQNIKRTFLTSALIIVSIFAQAQSINTYSPYSRYGVGQIPTRGFAGTKGMGGISQAVRNPYGINYLNPASYSTQDSMSFILDFGFETGATRYESQDQSTKNGFGGIHHIAISFPVTKWWGASLGLVPYSQVGYQIKEYETDINTLSSIGRIKYYHRGSGGINQAFIGHAFKPIKNLSVGFNLSYFFGKLDYSNKVEFPIDKPEYYNTTESNSISISDMALSFGTQYTAYIDKKEKSFFIFGATLDNETKIRAKRKYLYQWVSGNATDTIAFKDSAYGQITFPKNISIGVSYTYKNKLFTSVEFSTQDWTNASFLGSKQPLTNSNTYRFGLEYTPNRYDLRSYIKRISYRFGYHYSNTYLKLNGHQINEMAFSTGLGFPFRNNTKFNASFEWGKRGTTNDGLIKETYGIFSLSLTFYDFWFIKRKYN